MNTWNQAGIILGIHITFLELKTPEFKGYNAFDPFNFDVI